MISADQLRALAQAATQFAGKTLDLTPQGGIRLGSVTDAAAVTRVVTTAGLRHRPAPEIVASPLSGRVGGLVDVREWVTRLDAAIHDEAVLAALSDRVSFGIDDGRGDVSGLSADVGAHALGNDTVALLLAGHDTGVRLRPPDVVPALVAVATRLEKHGNGETSDDTASLLAGLPRSADPGATWPPVTRPPVGWLAQDDGRVALGAAVPMGVMEARVAEFLAAIEAPMVITPWRSVLVCDLDEGVADVALRVLAPMGLVFDADSPWLERPG